MGAYGEDCARGHRGDGCDARRASPRARHPGLRRQRRHGHRRRHRRRRLHPRHLRSRRCASDPRGGPRGSPVAAEAEEAAAVVSEDPDSEPEPDVSSLDAKALAIQLLDEIPTWQKALAAGVPATALLAVIIAARKWSHLESSKRREGESLRRIRSLSAALAEVESKLAAIVDERDEAKRDFESWKETMEKDAAKRDKLAEEKLQAAFAETAEVRQELALAKRKLEEVGLTKEELAKARELNTELQRQLGEASEANMAELEKLHDELDKSKEDARAELEEALRATEALRAELADAQREVLASSRRIWTPRARISTRRRHDWTRRTNV